VQGGPTNAYTTAGFTSNGGVRIAIPAGFTNIQAIMTAYTSGTATVVINISAGVSNVEVLQFNAANLQATVTQQALTKGTQGSTGVSNQALKDAGRNVSNFFMASQILTTGTDTLQSLTGYKSGAAVTATTTPAVVTTGKTYRITSIQLTYVAVSAAGSAQFTLRANTGGTVVIGSPAVASWQIGAESATAGIAQTMDISFSDGLEFAAGTGIGISMVGLNTTGGNAAAGYGKITINGYEY
jgi:hypothetical protein